MANCDSSSPLVGGEVAAAIERKAQRNDDDRVLARFVAIAKPLLAENEPTSFMLVDVEDLTANERQFMAEALRRFASDFIASRLTPTGRADSGNAREATTRDWRYLHLMASNPVGAETLASFLDVAMARTEASLTELGRKGSSGVWLENESLLAIRRVLEEVRQGSSTKGAGREASE